MNMHSILAEWRAGLRWTIFMMIAMSVFHFGIQNQDVTIAGVGRFVFIWIMAGVFFTVTISLARKLFGKS